MREVLSDNYSKQARNSPVIYQIDKNGPGWDYLNPRPQQYRTELLRQHSTAAIYLVD